MSLSTWRTSCSATLDEEKKAQRARAVDQRARVLAEWLDAQAARDSNGDGAAWRLKPCSALMFVNGAGELDQKHDQDLRDTCVMLLDRAGCDLLTICDITGHSYRSAQTIVKHYRARNAESRRCRHRPARIAGVQGRDEGLSADGPPGSVQWVQFRSRGISSNIFPGQGASARRSAPLTSGDDVRREPSCSSKAAAHGVP